MKKRLYTQGITFFTTTEMYDEIKKITVEKEVALSELLRNLVDQYLKSNVDTNNFHDSQESS